MPKAAQPRASHPCPNVGRGLFRLSRALLVATWKLQKGVKGASDVLPGHLGGSKMCPWASRSDCLIAKADGPVRLIYLGFFEKKIGTHLYVFLYICAYCSLFLFEIDS